MVCGNGQFTLKVLHVIPSLGAIHGGPTVACLELCRAIAKLGAEVSIFATELDAPAEWLGREPEGVCVDGVNVRLFPYIGGRRYWFSLSMWRALKCAIESVDVVHIHSLYRPHLIAAAYYCWRKKRPYIIRPHGSLDPFLFRRNRWLKSVHECFFERRILKGTAAIQFTADEERELALSTGLFGTSGNRTHLESIPNGVVVPEGFDAIEGNRGIGQGDLSQAFPEVDGRKVILFLSRINFKKGLDILVDAFALVLREEPTAHLVIAGPDNEGFGKRVKGWIAERGIGDHVTFTGMLTGRAKENAFRSADVFVLSSYTENFGIAVVEALSYGVPTVVSDKVNIWREIEAAHAGLIVPCEPEATAAAILSVLHDETLRDELSRNGPILVHDRFTWDVVARQMMDLYRRVDVQQTHRERSDTKGS